MSKSHRIIHVTSVGSSAADEISRLGLRSPNSLVELIGGVVGPKHRVTCASRIIMTPVNEAEGGRADDAARAADIETALADDDVAALVCIRGGAWFVRIMPLIDFDVLRRRKTPIFVFGFSEMTALVGVAGAYPKCVGLYDLCPGFIFSGLRREAEANIKELTRGIEIAPEQHAAFAAGWARAKFLPRFLDFFGEVVDIIDGRGTPRHPSGTVVAGRLPAKSKITVVGGNLSLIESLLPRYAGAFETRGRWLALEEINESPDRFDRMMAALNFAGLFDRAEGILIGDFQDQGRDLRATALAVLKRHLPPRRQVPIVSLDNFGHIWPMAPLPLHREMTLVVSKPKRGPGKARIEIPWKDWAQERDDL
jgi:muramoyltetrapeptide carboxypeptidase